MDPSYRVHFEETHTHTHTHIHTHTHFTLNIDLSSTDGCEQ